MDPSLESEISNNFDQLSIEGIQSRHRKERRDLQAKIQELKKNAPKSDKKKRKEALDEICKLEADLEKKQLHEIKVIEDKNNSQQPTNENHSSSKDHSESNRVTKAQKRRNKKALEFQQRENEIKASVEDTMIAPKVVEARKLQLKLKERQLASLSVPSDGDCLYNAIRHQLSQHGLTTFTIKELRHQTADYIEANKDSLIPYMTHQESGDLLTDEEFVKYCDDVRHTSSWGGQIELKALSSILKVPIEVLQADGSPTVQGAEFGGTPLIITYHRHMYSLGEHYNSTTAVTTEPIESNNEIGSN